MPAARDWELTIRAVVSHALSQRGCRQVLFPIPWQGDQVDQIRDAVVEVYEEFQHGIEPNACVARTPHADEQALMQERGTLASGAAGPAL
jgi:hypothetical protein